MNPRSFIIKCVPTALFAVSTLVHCSPVSAQEEAALDQELRAAAPSPSEAFVDDFFQPNNYRPEDYYTASTEDYYTSYSPEGGDYEFRLGAVDVNLWASTSFTYDDNIALSENNRREDFIFTPRLGLNALWEVTEINTLRVDIGLGYSFYMENTSADNYLLTVTPDSAVELEMYVGDFQFTFYDEFSLQNDAVDNPTINDTLDYSRFINTAGMDVVWDLNDVEIGGGYYYRSWIDLGDDFSTLNRNTHGLRGKIGVDVTPATTLGVQSNFSMTEYEENFQNDNIFWNAGPFIRTVITENVSAGAAAYFTLGDFEQGGRNGDTTDFSGGTFEVYAHHAVNDFLSHRLLGGRTVELGSTTNFYEFYYVRHKANWNIASDVALATNAFAEWGADSGSGPSLGSNEETFMRYGFGLSVGYQMTERLSTSANYDFVEKLSDEVNRDYFRNRISLNLRYDF